VISNHREGLLGGENKMTQSGSKSRFSGWMLCFAVSALALSACSKKSDTADNNTPSAPTDTQSAAAPVAAASPAAPAPAADNTDTITGVKLASYTGDAVKGKTDFVTCQTCHSGDAGVNKIGPSLHAIVGRHSGSIADYTYSPANKSSGIVWTPEKLFQYLESPQRIVPGTKMTFVGFPDPQTRADVIAYLQTLN
jgi:cytochrome c